MRIISALALAAGTALTMVATVQPAEASGYRYWSYYHHTDDAWQYAQVRMDGHVPADGEMQGWRFVTAEFGDDTRTPRVDLTFDDVCGTVQAPDGQKRVGLVIDYGRDADAPDAGEPPQVRAACAVVDDDATTAMALSSVADLRLDDDRLCGIDGYPSSGCNDAVDPLPADAAENDDTLDVTQVSGVGEDAAGGERSQAGADPDDGPGVAVWAGFGVAVAVVLGVALTLRRRRP